MQQRQRSIRNLLPRQRSIRKPRTPADEGATPSSGGNNNRLVRLLSFKKKDAAAEGSKKRGEDDRTSSTISRSSSSGRSSDDGDRRPPRCPATAATTPALVEEDESIDFMARNGGPPQQQQQELRAAQQKLRASSSRDNDDDDNDMERYSYSLRDNNNSSDSNDNNNNKATTTIKTKKPNAAGNTSSLLLPPLSPTGKRSRKLQALRYGGGGGNIKMKNDANASVRKFLNCADMAYETLQTTAMCEDSSELLIGGGDKLNASFMLLDTDMEQLRMDAVYDDNGRSSRSDNDDNGNPTMNNNNNKSWSSALLAVTTAARDTNKTHGSTTKNHYSFRDDSSFNDESLYFDLSGSVAHNDEELLTLAVTEASPICNDNNNKCNAAAATKFPVASSPASPAPLVTTRNLIASPIVKRSRIRNPYSIDEAEEEEDDHTTGSSSSSIEDSGFFEL